MITVITTNRDNVAKMTVETTCSAIENWRPYWRDFKSFISKSGYRALPKGAR